MTDLIITWVFVSVFPGTLRTPFGNMFSYLIFSPNYNHAYLEEAANITVPSLLLLSRQNWSFCRKISCPVGNQKFPTGFGLFQLSWSCPWLFWCVLRLFYANVRLNVVESAIFVAYKRYGFWLTIMCLHRSPEYTINRSQLSYRNNNFCPIKQLPWVRI